MYFASNTKYEFVLKNSTSRRLETNKKGVKTSAACDIKSERNKVKSRDETRKEIFVCMCITSGYFCFGEGSISF